MRADELEALVGQVQQQKSESQSIEVKTAQGGFPKIYDTLSAFSNQDGGGTIIFGVDESEGFRVAGVYSAEDVQKKIMEACAQMEPKVRAVITLCEIDGKAVVSAEIPGAESSLRPVFYRGVGRLKGSYVRVGDSDEPMSEYEIYEYEAFRRRVRNELRVVDGASLRLLDRQRLADYLQAVKDKRRNLAQNVSDEDILELMGVTRDSKPTVVSSDVRADPQNVTICPT